MALSGLAMLLAAALLLGAGGWGLRQRSPAPLWWAGLAALCIGALGVRLWWVPALQRHLYDGHEAEHLQWFLDAGTEAASRGADTLAYPLMQAWWGGLGLLLPADPRLPVVISALVGAAGVCVVAAAARELADGAAWVGWVAGGVALLHPTQAAWSSSAYNVILPHTLGMLAVTGAAAAARIPGARWPLWLAAGALALAVAGRLEAGVYALACLALVVGRVPARCWLGPAAAGAVLGGLAVGPVVGAGPLPGAEERLLAWSINLPLFVFHALLVRWWSGLAVVGLAAAATWRWPRAGLAVLGLAVANHVLMSSFDDYGARHTLPALVGVAWAVGAGWAAAGRWGGLAVAAVGAALLADMADLRGRYYGTEEAFAALLAEEEAWSALPRTAQRPGVAEGCGWIAEDPRVAGDPPRSHFNLLDPAEAEGLRGPEGCLHWCLDVEDWRWSSRGVRDRALRLERLYDLEPIAVVVEQDSGYACLVMRVGRRRSPSTPRTVDGHGRRHSADPGVP